MELLVFGHAGAKVIMFPTRDGRFFEYEDIGIVGSLRAKVEAGQLQLYCIEGLARETFYNRHLTPPERLARHERFEAYVLDEVLPFAQARNAHDCVIAQGCSLGAFQASSLVFRHPDRFRKLVSFSARHDLTLTIEHFGDLLDGHRGDDVYFHMPTHFLPGLACEARLESLKALDIVLVVGKDDPFLESNQALSQILTDKEIPHRLHYWDGRAHRGGAWRRMAPLFI